MLSDMESSVYRERERRANARCQLGSHRRQCRENNQAVIPSGSATRNLLVACDRQKLVVERTPVRGVSLRGTLSAGDQQIPQR